MRRKIVAGNWKMNLLAHEAAELFNEIQFYCSQNKTNCETFIFPSNIYLAALQGNANIVFLGAQNISGELKGALTGELSVTQLKSIDVLHSLVGHSERRSVFGETNEIINKKVLMLLSQNMIPILCIGESLNERESEKHYQVIEEQLTMGLKSVSNDDFKKLIVAYEPVWAIGTGKTASPDQAQDMHKHIRRILSELYSSEDSNGTSILYGGSVKPENAKELFDNIDVDGGLVGGASLNASDFIAIIKAFD